MFFKIATIGLIASIGISKGAKVWDGYTATWAEDPKDGFYHLPQRLKIAECQGWTEISGAEVSGGVKAMGYKGDPRFIILFSECTGKVLGHQVSFLVSDMKKTNNPINYTANPAITERTLNGERYYTGRAFYHEDERTNTRSISVLVNGELVEIPTKAKQVSSETPYFLKRCVHWMGLHYYQIDATTDCSSIFPWVLLRVDEDIIGINFQAIGSSSSAPSRTWFETLPLSQLAYTLPDAPPCLVDDFAAYGAISFHVWFKKDPLTITCANECRAQISSPDYGREEYPEELGENYNSTGKSGNICPV